MTYKDVELEKLFRLMQEYDIAETTLKNGKTEVMVKRNKEPVPGAGAGSAPEQQEQGAGDQAGSALPVESDGGKYHDITAPLVGVFYRASAPDAAPFVEVGDRVDAGDVVCIVEAMKSLNEIQAEVNGVVKEICVENAQLVEFEQVMFKVDLAA